MWTLFVFFVFFLETCWSLWKKCEITEILKLDVVNSGM